MSVTVGEIKEASVLIGPQFSEPMRVIGSPGGGNSFIIVNLVGTRTHTFRGGVTLTKQDLQSLQIENSRSCSMGRRVYSSSDLKRCEFRLAQEYDPYFGLSISRVDPLPHQLDAVYNHLLKSARVGFCSLTMQARARRSWLVCC